MCFYCLYRSIEGVHNSEYNDGDESSIKFVSLRDKLVKQDLLSYIVTVGKISIPSTYIVMNTFKMLKQKVIEKTGILLVRPKGCGKSVALVGVYLHLKAIKKEVGFSFTVFQLILADCIFNCLSGSRVVECQLQFAD